MFLVGDAPSGHEEVGEDQMLATLISKDATHDANGLDARHAAATWRQATEAGFQGVIKAKDSFGRRP